MESMASYQKRGGNSFLLIVEAGYNAKGRRIRRTKTIRVEESLLKTKRKLENHLNQELVKFEMEVQAGEYIAPEKKTIAAFKEDWLEKHAVKNLALRTRQNYEEKLNNYILPFLGHMKVSEVKPIHIVNFMNEVSKPEASKRKREGLSDSTLYEIDKTLRVLFNRAVEWRIISKSPLSDLRRPKIKRKEMKFLEGDEVHKLFEALQNEPSHWRLYFLTATIGGFRRGELIALQWSDIDFENEEIIITNSIPAFENGKPHIKSTKTNEYSRHVPMPSWYMELLKEHKLEYSKEKLQLGADWQGEGFEFIFHSGEGKPYWPASATRKWSEIRKKYNIKNVRLHDLRHTMVTLLIEEGAALKAIQQRAGHSSSKITSDVYGHLTKKVSRSTAEKFEKYNPNYKTANESSN